MTGNIARPYGLKEADITAAGTTTTPTDTDDVVVVRSGGFLRLSWDNLKAAVKSWLTGISNTWSQPQISSVGTVAYGATIAIDAATVPIRNTLTLTGDVTDLSVTSLVEGQQVEVLVVQDATGGHTATWTGVSGTEPSQNTTADAWTLYCIRRINGANYFIGGLSS